MACSPCITTVGFQPGCKRSPAGAKTTLYFLPVCLKAGDPTTDPYTNIVTSLALEGGAEFVQVTARQQSVNIQEPPNGTTGSLLPQITLVLESLSDAANDDLARQEQLDFYGSLIQNDEGFIVIAEEANGVRRIFGLEGAMLYSDGTTFDSGTARTDQPATTIVLQGTGSQPAPVLDRAYVIPLAA